jgi:hypothetical protein
MTKNTRISQALSLLGALAACSLLATACSQATASESAHPEISQEDMHMKDIESLKEAEQIWVKSLTTADAKLLATLIDERFSFIGPDAQVEDRKAYLAGYEGMKQAGITVEGIDLSELDFRVLHAHGAGFGDASARIGSRVSLDAVAQLLQEVARYANIRDWLCHPAWLGFLGRVRF